MDWVRGPTIGRGSSAAVSLATTATGQLFAVKSADISSSNLLRNEQHLISQLCSPFIVKCFGSDITRENNEPVYNVFLEYIAGGTLSDHIRSGGGSLDEGTIRFYARQMLEGLNYLHMKGFVHCDIKGQNILIDDDVLKIADFGCSKLECGGSATPAFAGTPAYMAPEVARGEEQSFPADVWALGCTVIEMATGSNPWPQMKDPASGLYRVAYSDVVPEIPSWFSDNAKDFVGKCLVRDHRERWTAAQLLEHQFFDSVEENSSEITKSNKKSPTSVMDQHFWDALELSDSLPDPAENSDSRAGRIRGLIVEDAWNFIEWAEEGWVTVRSNIVEECSRIQRHTGDSDADLIAEDRVTVSAMEEEIETSFIITEDSLFDSFGDEVSNISIGSLEFMLFDCEIDDSVPKMVAFQRTAVKNFLWLFLKSVFFSLCVFSPVFPAVIFLLPHLPF